MSTSSRIQYSKSFSWRRVELDSGEDEEKRIKTKLVSLDSVHIHGADNRPPMLEKDMYDSWKSIMELYMMKSIMELQMQFKLIVMSRQQISFSKDYHQRSMHLLAIIESPRTLGKNSTSHARNFIDETGKRV
ncbi:hypothetical protein Tco_1053249 [Tanacetum coccineum]